MYIDKDNYMWDAATLYGMWQSEKIKREQAEVDKSCCLCKYKNVSVEEHPCDGCVKAGNFEPMHPVVKAVEMLKSFCDSYEMCVDCPLNEIGRCNLFYVKQDFDKIKELLK